MLVSHRIAETPVPPTASSKPPTAAPPTSAPLVPSAPPSASTGAVKHVPRPPPHRPGRSHIVDNAGEQWIRAADTPATAYRGITAQLMWKPTAKGTEGGGGERGKATPRSRGGTPIAGGTPRGGTGTPRGVSERIEQHAAGARSPGGELRGDPKLDKQIIRNVRETEGLFSPLFREEQIRERSAVRNAATPIQPSHPWGKGKTLKPHSLVKRANSSKWIPVTPGGGIAGGEDRKGGIRALPHHKGGSRPSSAGPMRKDMKGDKAVRLSLDAGVARDVSQGKGDGGDKSVAGPCTEEGEQGHSSRVATGNSRVATGDSKTGSRAGSAMAGGSRAASSRVDTSVGEGSDSILLTELEESRNGNQETSSQTHAH